VSFAEPGGYTVYFEGVGASDEQVSLPPFRFSLTTVGGAEVSIRPYGGSATYGLAGHSGRAVATFQIEEPAGSCSRQRESPRADRQVLPLAEVSARESSAW
jgi:hypothetical protein